MKLKNWLVRNHLLVISLRFLAPILLLIGVFHLIDTSSTLQYCFCKSQNLRFKVETFKIQNKVYHLKTAKSFCEHTMGLMDLSEIGADGMIFYFNQPQILKFWMKNTNLPLDLAYLDEHMKITEILHMPVSLTPEDYPIYASSGPAKYAIEAPLDFFERQNIHVGDTVLSH